MQDTKQLEKGNLSFYLPFQHVSSTQVLVIFQVYQQIWSHPFSFLCYEYIIFCFHFQKMIFFLFFFPHSGYASVYSPMCQQYSSCKNDFKAMF
jgi:hypothetical protein